MYSLDASSGTTDPEFPRQEQPDFVDNQESNSILNLYAYQNINKQLLGASEIISYTMVLMYYISSGNSINVAHSYVWINCNMICLRHLLGRKQ